MVQRRRQQEQQGQGQGQQESVSVGEGIVLTLHSNPYRTPRRFGSNAAPGAPFRRRFQEEEQEEAEAVEDRNRGVVRSLSLNFDDVALNALQRHLQENVFPLSGSLFGSHNE